ncbi:MBL fold metallo-hydrolase RNA specificity domain-containing protein [Pseudomonas sp.]|uniref:MBL fold metallo-hydrolase RNA specificity domain-containing protein n=1 Tax=Pseudomonas sp. TaxID=306 RepID=UPI0028A7EBE5|nr:MBL fold metallo-hydrolase RNA specificity domain-containing protein [Pseudomonas sp.]
MAMLGDESHNVLFAGYQAKGTPGHEIQTYGPKGGYVDLDGGRIDIRASTTSTAGYSAHADRKGLVEVVTGMQQRPTEIRVVRGEEGAKRALAVQLRKRYERLNLPVRMVGRTNTKTQRCRVLLKISLDG